MDRPRCLHCRNPIKDHQLATGAVEGDRTHHVDCWRLAGEHAPVDTTCRNQEEYQRRVASEGLTALLSPYVSVFPNQRAEAEQPGHAVEA